MTLTDFIFQANRFAAAHPKQRKGEAYWNFLWEVNARAATDVTRTQADPFYRDDLIGEFLETLVLLGFLHD